MRRAWRWPAIAQPVALCLLAAALCWWTIGTFSPGFMSTDTLYQLRQALGQVQLSDWHPPLMSLLWGWLISVTGTWASMLVLQVVVLWAALLTVALVLLRSTRSFGLALLALAIGVLPQVVGIVGVIWKDVQLAAALLAVAAICLLARRWRRSPWARWTLVPLAVVLLVYALMVRKNGVFAILPLLYLLAHAWFPRSRWRAPVAVLVAVGALTWGTQALVDAQARPQQTHQLAQVMIDDIIHVVPPADIQAAHLDPDLTAKLLQAQHLCQRRNSLVNAYWTCYGTGEYGPFTAVAHYDEIQKAWPGLMQAHAGDYVAYRWQAFSLFLFEHRDTWQPGVDANDLGIVTDHPRMAQALRYYVQSFAEEDVPFVFGAWLWLAVGIALVVRARRRGPYRAVIAMLGLSAALYVLGYAPVVPATDFRYVYWPGIAGSLGLLLVLAQRAELAAHNREETPS